jgi:hypothetical protein
MQASELHGSSKLDLHGIRHYEVDRLVENFILMNQNMLPLTIVCGNSQTMIDLAQAVVDRINCREFAMDRYGVIVIRRI